MKDINQRLFRNFSLVLLLIVSVVNVNAQTTTEISAAQSVMQRLLGDKASIFQYQLKPDNNNDHYQIRQKNNQILISGNSPVALCRGSYDYLKNATHSMICWSGEHINIPREMPAYQKDGSTPFHYRYYMNVVTRGYTTPYWNWNRWQKEIDWMAVHGVNMPLIGGAYEAIMYRVLLKLGLQKSQIDSFFTGPAFTPWNRMGNITGWDGPPPADWYQKQIKLTHQILDRLHALKMQPIIPAFAGFVPKAIQHIDSSVELKQLRWGGFSKPYAAYILLPDNPLFTKIGKLFIQEWEKEFGKAKFYLADSFNEMEVPPAPTETKLHEELTAYGKTVYQSIKAGDPDATWVMQGWTFPYYKKDGKRFWTPERLSSLLSAVPDDKCLILDLANEYNLTSWHIPPSWKTYKGFFGKKWIYSFAPNMGGRVPWNGILNIYANAPVSALKYPEKGELVGYGFAPEGIENNELVFELICDRAWRRDSINLDVWMKNYCEARYGAYPDQLKKAFELFRQSCYNSFTSYPVFRYQKDPGTKYHSPVNDDSAFFAGVRLFLACRNQFKNVTLYQNDAITVSAQYLSLVADQNINKVLDDNDHINYQQLDSTYQLLTAIDKLLASHPSYRLFNWINKARNWGDNEQQKDYYEADAKRILTTWGGHINDYAARMWSGLIRDYYIPRLRYYFNAKSSGNTIDLHQWAEQWINKRGLSQVDPFPQPVEAAAKLIAHYPDPPAK